MKHETHSMKQEAHSMKIVTVIAIAASLIVGALLGHFVPPLLVRKAEPAAKTEGKTSEKRADRSRSQSAHEADLNRLRARIRDLESQLAAATEKSGEATEEKVADTEERPQNPFLRNGPPRMPTAAEMRANMEELREKDPARYAQMTNNFARWQEHRLKRTNDRLDILASVDTSRLNAKERQTHEALQDAIVKREELRQMLNPQNEDVTEEQRRATFEELRKLDDTMRQLETRERNTLLTKTARSFGVSAANAKEMTETIKAIYEATGGGGHHGPPGGPHGGGRGRR